MKGKEIVVGENKISYAERTNDNKTIFIFLNGWEANYKIFYPIYKRLDNYLVFDFPGFGQSSKLKKPWRLNEYAELVKKIIDKKVFDKKIIFVAHSFGGRVLLKLLSKYNIDNIDKIIYIGVPFIREYNYKKKIIYFFTKIFKKFELFFPKVIVKKNKNWWYKMIGVDDYSRLTDDVMKQTFVSIINEDIYPLVNASKKYKNYFIWGSKDKEASLSMAKTIASEINAKLYIITDAGHFPFIGKTKKEFINIFNKII